MQTFSLVGPKLEEQMKFSVISSTQLSGWLHPTAIFSTLFSFIYSVPRRLLIEGGVESIDVLFLCLPFVGVLMSFTPKLFWQLQHLQSMHPLPAVKQGHLVLCCPLASTQKPFSAFLFIFFSPHLHRIIGFSLSLLSTLPQERHLHRSRLHAWPLLTQGQRAVPPFFVHVNLSRDFMLLPHLHPTFPWVVWLLGSWLSSDSPLSCAHRP